MVWDRATVKRFIADAEEADRAGKIPHFRGAKWDDKETVFDRLEWAARAMEDEALAQGELPPRGEVNSFDWKEWRARHGKKAQIDPATRKMLSRYYPDDPALYPDRDQSQ